MYGLPAGDCKSEQAPPALRDLMGLSKRSRICAQMCKTNTYHYHAQPYTPWGTQIVETVACLAYFPEELESGE